MLIASACFLNVHKNNRDVSTVRSSLKLKFITSTEILYCYFDSFGKIFGCRDGLKSVRFRHLINVVKGITQVLSPEFKRCIVCVWTRNRRDEDFSFWRSKSLWNSQLSRNYATGEKNISFEVTVRKLFR